MAGRRLAPLAIAGALIVLFDPCARGQELAWEPAAPAEEAPLYQESHALVIGIGQYLQPVWPRLGGAASDARLVADELRQLGFEVDLVTDEPGGGEEPSPSLTASALADRIRQFLVTKGATPEARLLIWYAGHGDTVNGEGFLVGADAPSTKDPSFPLHAIQLRDIDSWVRLARAKHVLAIFDSCFAGTIFRSRSGVGASAAVQWIVKLPVRQFITSGTANEEVRDDSGFRDYFLRAIRGDEPSADSNQDGYVTGTELGVFLAASVQGATRGFQVPQYGKLLDHDYDQGDFVFELPRASAAGGEVARTAVPAVAERTGASPVEMFQDCEVCPQMVAIPAGSFDMGSPPGNGDRDAGEEPQHRVVIRRPFAIGAYEVTFAEWDACTAAGGCNRRPDDAGWGRDRQPVMRVSWDDAMTYVRWLSRQTNQDYRLPTEAEWEYAARAGRGTASGSDADARPGSANCDGCGRMMGTRTTTVGSLMRNPFGLYDVLGNVWEWAQDCWVPTYVGAPDDGSAREPPPPGECRQRVVRGGSWANDPHFARCARRLGIASDTRSTGVGFRVARRLGR